MEIFANIPADDEDLGEICTLDDTCDDECSSNDILDDECSSDYTFDDENSSGDTVGEDSSSSDTFVVPAEDHKSRLDVAIACHLRCSRSQAQDWIKRELVRIDGVVALRPADKVRSGQTVTVVRPPLQPAIPQPDPSVPIDVVYEDEHLLVLNKRRGITVHPGSGAPDGTLVNGLLAYCRDLSGIHGVERPGIVHRLDKDTSGLLVVAKNDNAHIALSQQFADRKVLKIYRALVHGVPPPSGRIDQPIGRHQTDRKKMTVRRGSGSRPSCTDFTLLESFGTEYAHVELHLHSGRTHQIRVHMTWLGYPLVGDIVYGKKPNPWGLQGQALHCYRLGFTHPASGEYMEFSAPFPPLIADILGDLRGRYGSDRIDDGIDRDGDNDARS